MRGAVFAFLGLGVAATPTPVTSEVAATPTPLTPLADCGVGVAGPPLSAEAEPADPSACPTDRRGVPDCLAEVVSRLDLLGFAAPGREEEYIMLFERGALAGFRDAACYEISGGPIACELVNTGRHQRIEAAVLAGLAEAFPAAGRAGPRGAAMDHVALRDVSAYLRKNHDALEQTPKMEFNAAVAASGTWKGFPPDQFVYGSTFFHSWLEVMRAEPLRARLAAAGPTEQFLVLGSSLGWQSFWAALTFGFEAVGWELVDHRVEAARSVLSTLPAGTARVQFHHGDVMDSDIARGAVVYLTDLMWDEKMRDRLSDRMHATCQAKGHRPVVVSNNWIGNANWTHISEVLVPVSWTSSSSFHLAEPILGRAEL